MRENDIKKLIEKDEWMMNVLLTVKDLHLPDWWLGAGFVRSKVWDSLHGYDERTPLPDIDVIYFDTTDFLPTEIQVDTTEKELAYEEKLKSLLPDIRWGVTNQARMHAFHNHSPYTTSTEALSRWVETATCIGAQLDENNKIVLTAPHGIEDLANLILRPTPGAYNDTVRFHERIKKKRWLEKWPKLKVVV